MTPFEAYTEAHNEIANRTEKAAVMAKASELGHPDPKAFYQKYQDYWKEGVKKAQSDYADPNTPSKRHPDAHTTQYKLDESSGIKIAMEDDGGGHHFGPTIEEPKIIQMDVLGSSLVQGPGTPLAFRKGVNENRNVKEFKPKEDTPQRAAERAVQKNLGVSGEVVRPEALDIKRQYKEDMASYKAAAEYDLGRPISQDMFNYDKALQQQKLDRIWKSFGTQKEKPSADILPFNLDKELTPEEDAAGLQFFKDLLGKLPPKDPKK